MLLPNRNHRLPNLFPESSSRFDVTTAGQMKEKWRQAGRIPIYLSRPLHRGVPRSNAFMRECAFAVRFPLFFLFYSFWMDEHLFTGHARVEHESSRGCFPPMIVIPFDTALNTNLTANWNTRNERAQKWRRDLLFRLFSNVRSAWSAHVYRAADSVVGCFSFCGGIMLNI